MSDLTAVWRTEARATSRRRWLMAVAALGVIAIGVVAAVAVARSGGARADALRAGTASVLLIGGLAVAVGLGAGAVNRDADGGWFGLMVGSGGRRGAVAAGRLAARVALMVGVLALWGVAGQVASVAVGRGGDGPLAVHTAAMAENMLLVLLVAALASVVLGPVSSGVVALLAYVAAQAFVNLNAAAEQGVIGSVAEPLVQLAHGVFPRAVVSPMISALQARGEASLAAPRFEINQTIVEVPAAGLGTVLWTLLWSAMLGAALIAALRRRALG